MEDTRHIEVDFNEAGDLVWYGHDLGPAVGFLRRGATEYEFWRYVRAPHVDALASAMGVTRSRLPGLILKMWQSDVQLREFADAHGIPTEFDSWISGGD